MQVPKYHRNHGESILLSRDNHLATRKNGSYHSGIVFTADAVKVNQKYSIQLTTCEKWIGGLRIGGLRIGVTNQDPSRLEKGDIPRFACPDLSEKEGFWIRPINEKYAASGNRITFYVNDKSQLKYFVNNEPKGVLLNNLTLTSNLWAVIDVYGNIVAVEFVSSDEAPSEIVAQGPEAILSYQKACESGSHSVFRTRLMLIGKNGVGKTCLKNALIGAEHNNNELSTPMIDLSASCSFNLRERKEWKLAIEDSSQLKKKLSEDDFKTELLENLEDEYNYVLACNLILDALEAAATNQNEEDKEKCDQPIADVESLPENEFLNNVLKDNQIKGVSDQILKQLEKVIKQESKGQFTSEAILSDSMNNGKNISLNIWDMPGKTIYYSLPQVFINTRAVYLMIFDLTKDLKGSDSSNGIKQYDEMSQLEYLDYWMHSIHVHIAQNQHNDINNTALSPPVIIVGTHRCSLGSSEEEEVKKVEEQFSLIKTFVAQKSYHHHIVPHYFSVENSINNDIQINYLRRCIEEISSKQLYMGEQIPVKWLQFEKLLADFVDKKTYSTSISQLQEAVKSIDIFEENVFFTMLQFYHDIGYIVYHPNAMNLKKHQQSWIVLEPQWLIQKFSSFIFPNEDKIQGKDLQDLWNSLEINGLLDEKFLRVIWDDSAEERSALLGIFTKFDLLCEQKVSNKHTADVTKKFYVPSCIKLNNIKGKFITTASDVIFYIGFNDFFPESLFHRLIIRTINWIQRTGNSECYLYYKWAKFYLDEEHDFIVEMSTQTHRMLKVIIQRAENIDESMSSGDEETYSSAPRKTAVAKVRNFLEVSLADLRVLWIKRLCYNFLVECICGRKCPNHDLKSDCGEECLHFLNLDECLSNKVVCCEHTRVRTKAYRDSFPQLRVQNKSGPILSEPVPAQISDVRNKNIEKTLGEYLPNWIKSCAKMLDASNKSVDWMALGLKLGYKPDVLEKMKDDFNPALKLLTDWIISSGNTSSSIDMLIYCLEQMARDDIVDIIQKGQANEIDPPQVFISYHWDIQDEVKSLKKFLERSGFACWMDIGQLGGGDQLYSKVDRGIRNSRILIACISPKYVVSHYCNRELSLADLLRKPILPIMFEDTLWPPPGGMSLILSPLIYIDLKGIGGHGGGGIHADIKNKYSEILQKITVYADPDGVILDNLSIESDKINKLPTDIGNKIPKNFNTMDTISSSEESTFNSINPRLPASNVSVVVPTETAIRPGAAANPPNCSVCYIL